MSDLVAEVGLQYLAGELRGVVPEGYKQTDVGVIPVDWAMETLGIHATFRTGPFGSALHKSDYVDGGVPVVNPMQIVDGKIVPTFTMAISESAAANLSEFRLSAGDIVIGRRGEMGRCTVVTSIEDGWLCGTGSMIIRVKKSSDADFLQRVLSSSTVVTAIENASVGTTMINLNQSTLRELSIALPCCKKEQTAIANALSDIDALISEQEKLIAKKQAIKTATMQQLLTGRTRLPQFALREDGSVKGSKQSELGEVPEDWEIGPVGRYLSITTGSKNTQDKVEDGTYPFFVRSQKVESINSFSFDGEGVLTAGDGVGTGKVFHYINGKCDVHQRVYLMHNFGEKLHGYFFFISFSNYFYERIMSMTAKSSVDSVRREMISNMDILLPSVAEQSAISDAILALNSEIQTHQSRLDKTREVKQGMMQELLTGKTRLVKPEQSK